MTGVRESAFFFDCEGDQLPGVLALPEASASTGVLVIVGGPQYRVGSHRQFVALARDFAAAGVACMRFDCRGMGDADGEPRDFEAFAEDIAAGLRAFRERVPSVARFVLFGLCDGATAAALFAARCQPLAGLILVNPWVRTDEGASRTHLRHYYAQRFLDRAMWRKLMQGRLGIGDSLRQLGADLRTAWGATVGAGFQGRQRALPERLLDGLVAAACPCLIVLSQHDYAAREFEGSMNKLPGFAAFAGMGSVAIDHATGADHTFSDREAGVRLSARCIGWLNETCAEVASMTPGGEENP